MFVKVRAEDGGVKSVLAEEVTAENYICPRGEEMFWHVIEDDSRYDVKTGKKLSAAVLKVYKPKIYKVVYSHNLKQGKKIVVVHDPEKWYEAHKEEIEATKAQLKARAVAAAKQQKEADKAALKAEILKELQEAGMIVQPSAESANTGVSEENNATAEKKAGAKKTTTRK